MPRIFRAAANFQHGARIEAWSDGQGMGSEFIVRLPVSRDNSVRPNLPHAKTREVLLQNPHRILVVDDNGDSADSLAQ